MPANDLRPLGNSGLKVSAVALGCWPIAGVTTLGVNDADSIATIQKCFDVGINHLDTAHVYGPNGESENLICRALAGSRNGGSRRDEMVIATKCGIHYENGDMVTDNQSGTPAIGMRRIAPPPRHRPRRVTLSPRP